MSLSSFTVCTNALRLNLIDIYNESGDKNKKSEINIEIEEEKNMTKTVRIEGMMCPHCEATVKKALEALDGVVSADVSHEKGTAVVTLDKEVDNAAMTKAVEDKDYKVLGIE